MKAVILAAGKGTRLYPLTIDTPKILLPLLGKPLIEWFLDMLKDYADEVVFVIGDNEYSKQIETFINSKPDEYKAKYPKVSFVYQAEQLGTGHALQAAKPMFNEKEKFILLYGDDLYAKEDLGNLLKHDFAIVGKQVSDPEKWGILQADEEGNLKSIVEKPEEFVGDIGNIGMYLVDSSIFDIFEQVILSPRGEYEVTDNVSLFAKENKMKVLAVEKYWLPLGYPWMILDAQEKLVKDFGFQIQSLENEENVLLTSSDITGKADKLKALNIQIEPNVNIKGNLIVGKNTIIKSGSYIQGDVIMAGNCEIGPNAYIRGITSLGDGVKVGMSEVKNSIVMECSALPHYNYFGDGIMGKHVNFSGLCMAMNLRHDDGNIKTMIKDKLVDTGRRKFSTVIGNNVKFGAASKIYPGRKVWPNLTTLPGQIIDRDLIE